MGWQPLYEWLSTLPSGTFVSWNEYEERTGSVRKSRSLFTRARLELEKEGRTLAGQNPKGFEVR